MATQKSLFQLANIAGYSDLPDSLLPAGGVVNGLFLSAIQANTDFRTVALEAFYQELGDGGQVSLFQSPSDGYNYQRSEVIYLPEIRTTLDMVTGQPGAAGGLLYFSHKVNMKTGKIKVLEAYYVTDGAQTNTNQGTLAVWSVGQRGRGRLTVAAGSPWFSALPASDFAANNALTASYLRQLNDNSKSINCEAFIMNGGGAPFWQPKLAYNVNDLAQPNYGFEDGCWYQCVIAGTSGATEPNWPGEIGAVVVDGSVVWIGVGFGFTNGQVVPYPKSWADGYQYSAADTIYYWPWFYWTGATQAGTYVSLGPSTGGRLQRLRKSVTTSTRVVNSTVTYWNGSSAADTNDGLLGVVAICFR